MKVNSTIIALALLILALVLHVGVVSPMSDSLLKTRNALTDEQIRLSSIELKNSQREDAKSRVEILEKENAKRRATWLSPLLNSYAMRVKSLIDAIAVEAGLNNVEYEEGALLALPVPKEQLPTERTARRTVRVKAQADYAAAVSFILRLEKEMPLLTLQSVSVQPIQGVQDRQNVAIVLEWPAKGEVIQ